MQLNEFTEYLKNFGEIQFLYRGKQYMVSGFWIKPLLRKGHVEYWFTPPSEDSKDIQKYETFDELLNNEIEGRKLRDILGRIDIIAMF